MATIRSIVVSLKAETKHFEKDMGNATKRMRAAKAVFKSVVTPAERYKQKIREIDILLKKGAITTNVHSRAINKLRGDYLRAGAAIAKAKNKWPPMARREARARWVKWLGPLPA